VPIITLLAVVALIFGLLVFTPSILGTSSEANDLQKYSNSSNAGNETIAAAEGVNGMFAGLYSGPLRILMYIVGIFLVIGALAYAVSINRKKRNGM